jgi:hypothetical protein
MMNAPEYFANGYDDERRADRPGHALVFKGTR